MRFLVTGAQGFLGSAVLRQLQRDGENVFATGRREFPNIHRCDLTEISSTREILKSVDPTCIIHCAAFVPTSKDEYTNRNLADENVLMLKNILATSNCPIVFMSSMTVYGPPQVLPFQEAGACYPQNPYGESKWLSETMLGECDRPTLSIRLPGLFGGTRSSGLVFNVLQALKYNRALPELPICPMYWAAIRVEEAAFRIVQIAKLAVGRSLTINLGYTGQFSVNHFLSIAGQIYGKTIEYKVKHPAFEFDLSLARALGVAPMMSYRDAVKTFSAAI